MKLADLEMKLGSNLRPITTILEQETLLASVLKMSELNYTRSSPRWSQKASGIPVFKQTNKQTSKQTKQTNKQTKQTNKQTSSVRDVVLVLGGRSE